MTTPACTQALLAQSGGPAIDAYVFRDWACTAELAPYLPSGWREILLTSAGPAAPPPSRVAALYRDSRGAGRRGLVSTTVSQADLVADLLDDGAADRVVLGYDTSLLTCALPNHYAARALVTAINRWSVERWLEADQRLFGVILIGASLPEVAAEEIRRVGSHERMVAVALGANALSLLFGHPVYHPIYRAASELALPVVLQLGSDVAATLTTPPVAGGLPATVGEYRAHAVHSHMSHVSNMIIQGVFDRFPELTVVLVGGGITWVPGFLWRLDYWYKANRNEAPSLTELPSEYFQRHFRVATHQLERSPGVEKLTRALSGTPWMRECLVYASGYGSPDWERPAETAARLPACWAGDVLRANAAGCFRWPSDSPTASDAGRHGCDSEVKV
jgi:uncharacterized protein